MADTQNNVVSILGPKRINLKLARAEAKPPSTHFHESARASTPDYAVVRCTAAQLIDHLDSLDRKGMSEDMKDRATVLRAMAEHFLDGFQDEPEPPRSA